MFPLLAAYLVCFSLYWFSGRIIALGTRRKVGFPQYLEVPVGLATSALLGYLGFWAYLLSARLGYSISLAEVLFVLAGAGYLAVSTRSVAHALQLLWPKQAAWALMAGLLYLGLFTLHGTTQSRIDMPADLFFETARPGDNLIPLMYAQAALAHSPRLTHMDAAGWYLSDRPPLQAGLVLMYRPLLTSMSWGTYYCGAGVAIEIQFVIALFCVCGALGFSWQKTRFIVLMCVLSGFGFYNSVYAWPKLLSGTLGALAILPYFAAYLERRRITIFEVLTGALAATLAVLAHGTAAFTMIPLVAMVVVLSRRFYPFRRLALGAALAALIYMPWSGYQHFVAPNNARLIKMHLAGVVPVTDVPFLALMRRSYTSLGWRGWIRNRIANLEMLAGSAEVDTVSREILRGMASHCRLADAVAARPNFYVKPPFLHYDSRSLGNMMRIDQTQFVFRALDFLNAGWVVLMIGVLYRGRSWFAERRGASFLLLANVATLLVWVILEFGPGGTFITTSSFTMMLLWFLLLSGLLYERSRFVWRTVAGLHLLWFLAAWVVLMPGYAFIQHTRVRLPIQLGPLLVSVICALWFASSSEDNQAPQSAVVQQPCGG